MLSNQKLKAFIPTVNLAEAKKFYGEILGLRFLHEDNFAVEFDAGGTLLRITKVPKLKVQKFTVLGWNVTNINEVAASLKKKGTNFQRYRALEQNENAVWTSPNGSKVAWFKDTDGNILSLTELPQH